MKRIWLLSALVLLLATACELDSFLFDNKEISEYKLPGNTIDESLLHPVTFESNGNTLYGYWVESESGRGLTLLYCHGNKNNIDEYWDRVMFLHDLDVNVFIFDYRGYGLSEGASSEQGLYEDGTAALSCLRTEYHIPDDSLCLYGYSLGNVVSIYLAAEKVNPLCLFAESPFASANSLTQAGLFLDIPAGWLTEGDFDNAERIKKIHTPFLLMHGEQDDFVRYKDNGRIVYENAPEPKKLVLVSKANHTDVPQTLGLDTYRALLLEWIGTHID